MKKRNGFTLLEILLVIGIMGVVAIFTIGISHSIRNTVQMNDTKGRMEQIAAKAREFYRAHESLPAPTGTPMNKVPVEETALNMEQKYRLDAWGQYIFYARVEIAPTIPTGTVTMTYVKGVSVNGRSVAGVLISGGPNQVIDGSFVAGTTPFGYLGGGTPATATSMGDDIVISIDVGQEAIEIALNELRILQSKVQAIDSMYEGIDNNSLTGTDESGCVPALPDDSAGCPPVVLVAASGGNDPNCGTATLDAIDSAVYPDCPATALNMVLTNYSLGDPQFRLDPWGIPYVWGRGAQATPSVTALVINGCTIERTAGDCRDHYHRFFSQGPSTTTNSDDIIP